MEKWKTWSIIVNSYILLERALMKKMKIYVLQIVYSMESSPAIEKVIYHSDEFQKCHSYNFSSKWRDDYNDEKVSSPSAFFAKLDNVDKRPSTCESDSSEGWEPMKISEDEDNMDNVCANATSSPFSDVESYEMSSKEKNVGKICANITPNNNCNTSTYCSDEHETFQRMMDCPYLPRPNTFM